jgi:hypothetical protein
VLFGNKTHKTKQNKSKKKFGGGKLILICDFWKQK